MLIFSHQSDMEDKLWNLVNIHIHDIVVECKSPMHLEESTLYIRSIIESIILLATLKNRQIKNIRRIVKIQEAS
ncbi:hypothetical protein MTR_3g081300 [Medicago truncatula]|uniref:Uncharacterized protein n=1 Tax=Medicago truncatula TaxID=3880 RepID=A0A072VAF5_MEDTR|nr:hypothetical protein MTR_3g081300 [Medicago truncatula]